MLADRPRSQYELCGAARWGIIFAAEWLLVLACARDSRSSEILTTGFVVNGRWRWCQPVGGMHSLLILPRDEILVPKTISCNQIVFGIENMPKRMKI